MTSGFSRDHRKHDGYYRAAYIILIQHCLQQTWSSSVSRNSRVLSFFLNSCKTLRSSVSTSRAESWQICLFCFILLSVFFLKARIFLRIPLKMNTVSTFASKDLHSHHQCAKANSIKAISMHSQPWHEFIFIFFWNKIHLFVFHRVFPNPT